MSSDKVYDADGDISRYLQSPSLESHSHVLAVPGDGEPAATHGGAPQHLPPVQAAVSVALPTSAPTPVNPSWAFGNDVQNHHAMPVDDVQAPLPGQYGFPADPVRAVPARDDDMHYAEPNLDHNVLPELLGNLSLHAHYSMDFGEDSVEALFKSAEDAGNNGSGAVAEHSVFPVEDDLTFVPFVRGQLDCSKCRPVKEVHHESANHKLRFIVHVGDDLAAARFQHAIIDRQYIETTGQIALNEAMYVDLRERTYGCAQNFIVNCLEMLKNDTSGTLTDSCIKLELEMLKAILSAPSSNTEAVGVPNQSGPEVPHQTVTQAEENTNAADTVLNAANWPGFSPAILETSQVSVRDGMMASSSDACATNNESQLAKQRRRISQLSMKDIARLVHMSKKDAANELDISMTAFKRLCWKNNTERWPARQIKSLDNKLKKLHQAAIDNGGGRGFLAIKEKIDKLEDEKAQVCASFLKDIKDRLKHNDGAGGSSG